MSFNVTTHFFKPLEHDTFMNLEHAGSLKGLFKGKRSDELAKNCEQLRDQLIKLAKQHVLLQVKAYPFALLPVELALQTTGAGTAFLRWRKKDRSAMGVHLWNELMESTYVSSRLIHDLYEIELQRITLNTQISMVHGLMRKAMECNKKMAHAKSVYEQRCQMK